MRARRWVPGILDIMLVWALCALIGMFAYLADRTHLHNEEILKARTEMLCELHPECVGWTNNAR